MLNIIQVLKRQDGHWYPQLSLNPHNYGRNGSISSAMLCYSYVRSEAVPRNLFLQFYRFYSSGILPLTNSYCYAWEVQFKCATLS